MKTYAKFLYRSFIGPFLATFCISLFILVMQFVWLYVDDLIGKGLAWYTIAKLMIFVSASLVPMALPLAMLLSSLMTFGNLGENYELVAFKSAGIPVKRIMRPLTVLAVLISIGAFVFANNVIPIANLKMKSLLYDITQQKPAINIKPNVFYNEIDGFTIRVKKKEHTKDGNILKNILIYDERKDDGNRNVTIAKWGKMSIGKNHLYAVMELHDGHTYVSNPSQNRRNPDYPFYRRSFKESKVIFDLTGFKLQRTNEKLFKDNYQMMNISQLINSRDTLTKINKKRIKRYFHSMKDNYLFFYDKNKLNHTTQDSTYNAQYNRLFHHKNFTQKHIEIDHYFDQFSNKYKARILNTAITISRSNANLCNVIDLGMSNRKLSIVQHSIEIHKKFTFSLACLILFFIGAPLGAIIRKGGLGMPVVVSAILFVIYYIVSISGERMCEQNVLPVWIGMWLATALYFPVGALLTYKATTDSGMFNINMYFSFFKKIGRIFQKKK